VAYYTTVLFTPRCTSGSFVVRLAVVSVWRILLAQPAVGWLSDRLGRRSLLAATFGLMTLALWMLSVSTFLWHFWLVTVILAVSGARTPLQNALVADTLRIESLGLGMALLSVSAWVGGIIGFGVAGNALQALGVRTALLAAGLLPILATVPLVAARSGTAVAVSEGQPEVAAE
jgi:MFS family permease